MNVESTTETLLMRTEQEPLQPARPQFTTENLNAWFELCATVNEKVAKSKGEIVAIVKDRGLTDQGRQVKFATLAEKIVKEVGPIVAAPLKDVRAAVARLKQLMIDPLTAKPKDVEPAVLFLSDQEIRQAIGKDDANRVFLESLESDHLDVCRALLSAPGGSWVSEDVRRRGEDAYAERTKPQMWETLQSLTYFQEHVQSLADQVRQWFAALGATPATIRKMLGDFHHGTF